VRKFWGNEYQIFDTLDADNIPLLEQLQRAIWKGQKNSPGLKPANKYKAVGLFAEFDSEN
jgi:hypothetical protein